MKKGMELDLKNMGCGGCGGQSGNESVTLCKNIWFPCRKRKKHARVQNAIRRLCAVTAGMTVISLFSIHVHKQMKRRRKNFLNPLFPASM